jgi:hypothetical protein
VGAYSAGDFNGDGFDDLWVLTVRFEAARYPFTWGSKYLVLGRSAPFPAGRFDPSLAVAEFATPPQVDPGVGGRELSTAGLEVGDFDGDGFTDVLAPSAQAEQQLFYGGPDKLTGMLGAAQAEATLRSDMSVSVRTFGDLDDDGITDIAVRPSDYSNTQIVYGTRERWSGSITRDADLTIEPPSGVLVDQFGRPVYSNSALGTVVTGDVDGDGHADIIAVEHSGFGQVGAIYVVHGDGQRLTGVVQLSEKQLVKRGVTTKPLDIPGAGVEVPGEYLDNDGLGDSLAIGDVNGDGSVDVLATAPGVYDSSYYSGYGDAAPAEGKVYLLPGAQTPQ